MRNSSDCYRKKWSDVSVRFEVGPVFDKQILSRPFHELEM